MDNTNKVFGERLKELRLEMGLSQPQLAKEAEVGSGAISDWENGKKDPRLSSLMKLAIFFKVPIDYLVGLKDY